MGKNKKVKQVAKFIKASELLKHKAKRIREYEVIRKPEKRMPIPACMLAKKYLCHIITF